MEEKENFKVLLLKHIIYNLIVFIIIFAVFGIFIFGMIRNITYNRIDNELLQSKQLVLGREENIDTIISRNFKNDQDKQNQSTNQVSSSAIDEIISNIDDENPMHFSFETNKDYQQYTITKRVVNPNVSIIVRDCDGNLIGENVGRLSSYTDELSYNMQVLDKIYSVSVGNKYYYRGLNFVIEDESDSNNNKYVQLLINVDSERGLVDSYFEIILSGVVICIILSIIASIILSKKTLNPLKENIDRQTEFVQNVSHELRTPLTIIQAQQELLLQEPKAKIIDKSEDIAVTLNETKRLSKLVKDLLILSRADSNKIELTKENINIDEYMKEITNPFKEIMQLEDKELLLDLNYNIDINVDVNKIYQLMIILLDNAIKYTEAGDKITVKTYAKENKCIIEIQDTGIGISDEGLKHIFERFYREDKARNRETGGSGLGLSIATCIVNAHQGSIKAIHNNPKGTVFIIRLPR